MPNHQMPGLEIREADIAACVELSLQIPEFIGPPAADEYERRLSGVPHLILVACIDGKAVGFKVGYQQEDHCYSWMGGVLPGYRKLGLAKQLAEAQEAWAKAQGYNSIIFKTRNQHKAMLIFALTNGFDIVGFREKETVTTNRILLRKAL